MVFAGEAQKTRYFDQKPKYLTQHPKNTSKIPKIINVLNCPPCNHVASLGTSAVHDHILIMHVPEIITEACRGRQSEASIKDGKDLKRSVENHLQTKARARVGAQSGLGPGPGWGPYGPIWALMFFSKVIRFGSRRLRLTK